jgi:hypothetical protein
MIGHHTPLTLFVWLRYHGLKSLTSPQRLKLNR